MYQKFQLHFIHYQLKVSGEEKSMPNESLNYIPMLSVFRTPSHVQHWGFPSHVQCGCHQWPYISLHLVGTSWSAENPPRAPSNTEQRSSRSPCSPQVLTSSQTSRTAATLGSSSGSMPPPGTIHRSGWRLLLTSSTCREQSTADGWTHSNAPSQSPAAGGEVSLSLSHLQPNTSPWKCSALPKAISLPPCRQLCRLRAHCQRGTPALWIISTITSSSLSSIEE